MATRNMWQIVKQFSEQRRYMPGMCFETTLLGRVPYISDEQGGYESQIPDELQRAACRHGFLIEAADYQRSSYTLRLILPSAL